MAATSVSPGPARSAQTSLLPINGQPVRKRRALLGGQALVARKTGSEGREAFREGKWTMADFGADTLPTARLTAAEPQLFVADIAASVAFYTRQLGFAVAFLYGEPPFYGQVFRDGARLNLRCVSTPVIDPRRRDREGLLSASITLADAEPLFVAFQASEVSFHQALRTEPWGARTFVVRDPDGNLILFSGRGG